MSSLLQLNYSWIVYSLAAVAFFRISLRVLTISNVHAGATRGAFHADYLGIDLDSA